eukprot:CAMPEP_0202961758 /NCGR_PEP_ID=MMETSP1396-20130829/5836_1 /ASSEMBLY_ACC=CAM_ASM_000872 /TAXON_ID= /ORGANISM="Pseudokeronopsis sp., Strain Brazil" /LENGTH=40 /DNA_ID= /DNA_START= /DNA_END= /DNA_ORIENTATION=
MKQQYLVQGANHTDLWLKGSKDYVYAMKDFMDKAQEYRSQ